MKKLLALITSVLMMTSAVEASAAAIRTNVSVRDPFVIKADEKYYMYGTGLAWPGYGCVISDDLVNWSAPVTVFAPDDDFDSSTDYWAPECHFYNGSYYLFATYRTKSTDLRGVGIFKADSPTGPFELISDGHITPKDTNCIDGTLYVDENGTPWMVYVGEWVSQPGENGIMCAAQLSEDLTHFVSEPVTLFNAREAKWADAGVTDGPFLYKTKTGKLIMLWSNFSENGYCVGIAYSSNGQIDGKWYQQKKPLYENNRMTKNDGGHGMLFTDKNGRLMMSIHSPNDSTEENPTHALFIPVDDIGVTLTAQAENNIFTRLYFHVYYFFENLSHAFHIS